MTKLINALKKIIAAEESFKTLQQLKQKIPQLVKAAQEVYDDWDQSDPDYGDWQVGKGGICHLIVDAMSDTLTDFETASLSLDTEVHVLMIIQLEEGVFSVDIPHSIYEKGGGYNWTKIPDVVFEPNDVVIAKLSPYPEDFVNYIDV